MVQSTKRCAARRIFLLPQSARTRKGIWSVHRQGETGKTGQFDAVKQEDGRSQPPRQGGWESCPSGWRGWSGQIFQDFNNTIVSSRSELRRRRFDLSTN